MEIYQIKYFMQAYEDLNYSKASEKLIISRQALSSAITKLEEELNGPLFTNVHNHLYPTRLGNMLYELGSDLVKHYNKVEEQLMEVNQRSYNIRLGVCSSLFPFFTPELEAILKTFKKERGEIKIEIESLGFDELMRKLDNNYFDVIITLMMDNPLCHYNSYNIQNFKFGATIVNTHPLAKQPYLTLTDLCSYKSTIMGDFKMFMYPLWKEMNNQGLKAQTEIVVPAIEAFNLIQNENYILYNSIVSDGDDLSNSLVNLPIQGIDSDWHLRMLWKKPLYEINVIKEYLEKSYKNYY